MKTNFEGEYSLDEVKNMVGWFRPIGVHNQVLYSSGHAVYALHRNGRVATIDKDGYDGKTWDVYYFVKYEGKLVIDIKGD